MNKYTALYTLGQTEGMIRVMRGIIQDTQLSGYTDGKSGRFCQEVFDVLEDIDLLRNDIVGEKDDDSIFDGLYDAATRRT